MAQPLRLPWSQRICYGVGHSLNDLCASMWFSYLIIYLQMVLGFDSNNAGLILLIGQTVDAIATPLLGYETSSAQQSLICRKYGKRKFLHLIGTIGVVLSFPFIFSVCPGCEKTSEMALTILLIPLVIIFQVGWAAVQVSHLSLIPVITPYEAERDFLNVFRFAVDMASDIGTYLVVWAVFDLTTNPSESPKLITREYASKFTIIVIIIVVIGSFFSVIFHLGVKEVPVSPQSSGENSTEELKYTPIDTDSNLETLSWKAWLREIHFYEIGLLYMFTRLYQNMSLVFMPLYLSESLKANSDFIAKIPLVMNVSSFIISCSLPKFFKVLSKKVTFIFGALMGIGACAWVSIGHGVGFCSVGIYGVGLMMGAASSILVVCSLSFTHDLIGTSSESGAFVYGCMSFGDKIANGIAGMIIQYMHSVHCEDCDWFYRYIMSYGLGATVIISTIMLVPLLPAKLGERQSSQRPQIQSNGVSAWNHKKQEIVNYNSIEDSGVRNGILKDH